MNEPKCCAPSCNVPVTRPHLMCISHWNSLPPNVRQEVQTRLKGWRSQDAALERIANYYQAKKRAEATA
jgi:hypothetical protein